MAQYVGINDWELVEEIEVTVLSGSTVLDFAATIDGDVDGAYRINGRIVNGGSALAVINLSLNLAAISANRQYIFATGAALSSARDTSPGICAVSLGETTIIDLLIPSTKTGFKRQFFAKEARDSGATIAIGSSVTEITSPGTATNITKIGLTSSILDGIGVGSFLQLWKRRK